MHGGEAQTGPHLFPWFQVSNWDVFQRHNYEKKKKKKKRRKKEEETSHAGKIHAIQQEVVSEE